MCANYPAAAFVIMMVTTVLLVPSSAAPTYHGSSSSDEHIADTWWYNACGHHSILHAQNKRPNNRSDMQIFRIVKNQLKLFNEFYNQELKKVKKLYAEAEPFANYERKSFDFLPKYVKPTNSNRSKAALKELQAGLQHYVVGVHYLEKLQIHSNSTFNFTARNEILVNTFNHIKSLICEVDTGVNATGQKIDSRITPDYPLKQGLSPDLYNLSEMFLHDTSVLYKLAEFIRKWNNNLMKRLPTNHKRESESEDTDNTMEIEIEIEIEIDDETANSIIE